MDLKQEIAKIIIDELKLDDVTPETFDENLDLVEELGIDSMELTTIVIKLREKYSIKIEEEDFENLTTLSKIVSFLSEKISSENVS